MILTVQQQYTYREAKWYQSIEEALATLKAVM